MKPKVLLVMTCCWVPPARLALALIRAGCEVEAVCPRGHAIAHIQAVARRYHYSGFARSIRSGIRKAQPDFIIPCDDYATTNLHAIYHSEVTPGDGSRIAKIIKRSLGNPENCMLITARGNFLAMAKELGIAVPDTEILKESTSLHDWLATRPFPAYVKADGTSGGVGVRRVETSEDAEQASKKLASPPGALRTLKRSLVDHDRRLLLPWLRHTRPAVSIQNVIEGQEANCAFACSEGKLLACISLQVVERTEMHGPASVLRLIDNAQMRDAAEKIVAKLGLTGLYGLDFILEEGTGTAYLLEMNARATQTCHLALGPGRNPVAALVASIVGKLVETVPSMTDRDTIALFPAEWRRDPASTYLSAAYHDVPWDVPELLQHCISPNVGDRLSYRKWQERRTALLSSASNQQSAKKRKTDQREPLL
jgi:formate-dependent phosphoribosylglycinamide formyltransferase (GAR transformylase)